MGRARWNSTPLLERRLRAARSAYACPEGRLLGTRFRSSTPMIDTLRPVPFASEMAISKTVSWLNEQLELGNERLLLMDCRPQELYESSHIESAINVAIPGIMLRRLQKGNLPVRALFTSGEDRDRFTRRCGTDTVVLYDESSSDWNENTGGESVLGLLLKKLKDEGCKAFYLEGMCRGSPARGARRGVGGAGLRAAGGARGLQVPLPRLAGASEPQPRQGPSAGSRLRASGVRHPRARPAQIHPLPGLRHRPFLSNSHSYLEYPQPFSGFFCWILNYDMRDERSRWGADWHFLAPQNIQESCHFVRFRIPKSKGSQGRRNRSFYSGGRIFSVL